MKTKMETAKILFSVPKKENILTKLIKFFQKTDFSHCAFFYKNECDFDFVYESKGLGERLISYNNYINDNRIVDCFDLKINDEIVEKLSAHIFKRIGSKYDYKQLAGYLLIWIARKTIKKEIKNPLAKPNGGSNCHEAVLIILRDVFRYKELASKNLDSKDLAYLYNFCKRELE